MQSHHRVSWGFRIGLGLCLMLGTAWGFALGVVQARVNSQLSWLGVIFAAVPIAFAGSLIVGLLFNGLARPWHKVARLLAALVVTAIGVPIGLAYGLIEQQLDVVQLFNTTGALTWNVEWLAAMLGLIGGMWLRWMQPILGRLALVPRGLIELSARFFEMMGYAFLWAPIQLLRAIVRPFENLSFPRLSLPRVDLPNISLPRRAPRPQSQPRETAPRSKRQRFVRPKAAARNHVNNDGLRVVGVVEDRCPYCLDIVKRNDPRGVRVCEVCGTPHHADCWAITGKCQVPHLNT